MCSPFFPLEHILSDIRAYHAKAVAAGRCWTCCRPWMGSESCPCVIDDVEYDVGAHIQELFESLEEIDADVADALDDELRSRETPKCFESDVWGEDELMEHDCQATEELIDWDKEQNK